MKKILVIGAGFLQSFIIKKAKAMGLYTFTIDKNPYSVGFKYAEEFDVVDITDQDACLKFALSKNIDGVITVGTDYGVLSAAYIAEQMNLPGLNYKTAKIIKNKYLTRRLLFENNVDDISQYYEISNLSTLDEISFKIKFPVMVKPCDGSGSKGTRRVDSISDMYEACNEALKSSLTGRALIEDFVEGKEYGVESFVNKNEIHVLGVMGKYMTNPPNYAELGHSMPSNLLIEEKVKEVVIKAIKALGINFGAVNMDVLVTNDNRICIVDVGTRMGGNLIGSHIIPKAIGIDYMEILIKLAVGDLIDIHDQRLSANVVTRLLALKPGKVKSLPDFQEIENKCQVDIYSHLEIGTEIREYRNNLDGYGYIVSVSNDIMQAERQAEKAKRLIDIGIIRE